MKAAYDMVNRKELARVMERIEINQQLRRGRKCVKRNGELDNKGEIYWAVLGKKTRMFLDEVAEKRGGSWYEEVHDDGIRR